jgi:hypothetical protein
MAVVFMVVLPFTRGHPSRLAEDGEHLRMTALLVAVTQG